MRKKYGIKGILISYNKRNMINSFDDLKTYCVKSKIYLKQFRISLDDVE